MRIRRASASSLSLSMAAGLGVCVLGCSGTSNAPPVLTPLPDSGTSCTPASCVAQGKNCGVVPDGCGTTVSCGSCGAGESCGGSGVPNLCGAPGCMPTTCAAQHANCGTIADGCGGNTNCGTCGAGQVCGGGGVANICGAAVDGGAADGGTSDGGAQLGNGATRWVQYVSTPADDQLIAVGSDGNGSVFHLENFGAGEIQVGELDGSGAAVWSRTYPGRLYAGSMSVMASGSLLVSGDPLVPVDFGNGPQSAGFIAELLPDGSFMRYVLACYDSGSCGAGRAIESPDGDIVYEIIGDKDTQVDILHADGTYGNFDPGFVWTWAFTVDPGGDILLGAVAQGDVTYGSQTFAQGSPLILKFGPDGRFEWVYPLPCDTKVASLGTSAAGTVVATVDDTLSGAASLYVLEKGGTLRSSQSVDGTTLTVDPSGRAALEKDLGNGCTSGVTVSYYDLAGDFLWKRELHWDSCASAAPGSSLVTLPNHDVILGGTFEGTADFGRGPTTSQGSDGFILDLVP